MAIPSGTVRTYTERVLVALLADLDGFSADPAEGLWHVTPAFAGTPTSRRWVVTGTPDGALDPDGIAAGHDPSVDEWTISCGLACTDVPDPLDAKQACEDALNVIADTLAADPRLGVADGPRSVELGRVSGPYTSWEQGKPLMAWINFELACTADIRRNP